MYSYERVWNLSKWRFLQGVASYWLVGDKAFEYLFFLGIIIFFYFDSFVADGAENLKYLGIVVVLFSAEAIRYRFGLYEGYFDGYEQGFIDAATRNCDYWDSGDITPPEHMEIDTALDEIEENEEKISQENKLDREKSINKGFVKLLGWILTWRKI